MKQDKIKIRRVFSEPFKRQKVQEIDKGLTYISEVARQYGVSASAVCGWLKKYSPTYQPTTKVVVEMESEAYKTRLLQQRVAELERAVGVKQIELDFLNELVEAASQGLGMDLRKDFFTPRSTDSVGAKKTTP